MIGVKKSGISSYENNVNAPKVSVLIQLFSALRCDANYFFQDYIIDNCFQITSSEQTGIVKYRALDSFGQKAINSLLEIEYIRCSKQNEEVASHNSSVQ